MHIPDGFLDAKTTLATSLLSAAALAFALRHARKNLPPRKVPLLGLSAAFVFAAQMINFPVLGGTSGHLVGGVLTAALLGPSAAIIVLATVLIVQCFAFADGGLTALGANIFNMGIISGFGGWMIYAALARFLPGLKGRIVAAVVASWLSTVLAALLCAGELSLSGTVPSTIVFPAMAGVHMLIGIGEGLITALVLAAIASVRPELVFTPVSTASAPSRSLTPILVYGFLAALGIGLFLSPFACKWPDGLDRIAQDDGFIQQESKTAHGAPLKDYQLPGLSNAAVATGIAGGIGTLAVFALGLLLARSMTKKPLTEPLAEMSDAR